MATAPIKRPTAAMQVAEVLRDRIFQGALRDGSQIRQEAVANELGVSRIPVREALKQLEAEGLVRIMSHRGAVVSELSLDQIGELFEIREVLEVHLLSLAFPNFSGAALDNAEAYCAEMERETAVGKWGQLNWSFHRALYLPANRPETLRIIDRIHGQIDRYVRLQIALSSGQSRANSEHRDLLKKCRDDDLAAATSALRGHIRGVWDSLSHQIRSRRGDV